MIFRTDKPKFGEKWPWRHCYLKEDSVTLLRHFIRRPVDPRRNNKTPSWLKYLVSCFIRRFSWATSDSIFTDLIRDIRDPEHPHTLEELNVVSEDCITVSRHCFTPHRPPGTESKKKEEEGSREDEEEEELWIKIVFTPTVPHCSLATLIGLCLRIKLEQCWDGHFKLDIKVSEGAHKIEGDVNKQINDKERVAAAMENPGLREMVEQCIKEAEYWLDLSVDIKFHPLPFLNHFTFLSSSICLWLWISIMSQELWRLYIAWLNNTLKYKYVSPNRAQ